MYRFPKRDLTLCRSIQNPSSSSKFSLSLARFLSNEPLLILWNSTLSVSRIFWLKSPREFNLSAVDLNESAKSSVVVLRESTVVVVDTITKIFLIEAPLTYRGCSWKSPSPSSSPAGTPKFSRSQSFQASSSLFGSSSIVEVPAPVSHSFKDFLSFGPNSKKSPISGPQENKRVDQHLFPAPTPAMSAPPSSMVTEAKKKKSNSFSKRINHPSASEIVSFLKKSSSLSYFFSKVLTQLIVCSLSLCSLL